MRRRVVRPLAARRPLAGLADERLVVLVRRGDESAFEELFDRHSGGVLSFCSRFLCSREEGEDAHQHAFLVAYQAIGQRDFEPRAFKPWLYAIARNRCLSVLRSPREARLPWDDESVACPEQTAERVEQRADVRELLEDVRDLPEQQRAALLLAEICGLSHTQVGQVIACPRAKVKSLVFQARASLSLDREARETFCGRVREQLAGSSASRLPLALRRHLKRCEGCREFAGESARARPRAARAGKSDQGVRGPKSGQGPGGPKHAHRRPAIRSRRQGAETRWRKGRTPIGASAGLPMAPRSRADQSATGARQTRGETPATAGRKTGKIWLQGPQTRSRRDGL